MRVAIVYPPIPSEKGVPLLGQNRQFQWFSAPTYIYPVVPAQAAALLKQAGHEALWLDGIAEGWSPEVFEARLDEAAPDLVLVETKAPVARFHWAWIAACKARRPGVRIALAGDHATALPLEALGACPVDAVLTGGDYDFLLLNLANHLERGEALEPGIYLRGVRMAPEPFRLDHDLDAAPFIDRELSHWRLYAEKNGNFRRTPGSYIMAGRDCWHGRCTFCSWTTLYPSYRRRSPERVLDEIGELIALGIREIMDDTGCFPAGEWLRSFCRGMIARGYHKRVTLDCNMRFGCLGAEDYALMKAAGFRLVLFGVESANQGTLDRLCKALKVEDAVSGAKLASRAGLEVHITLMFGYPWESREDVARTVALGRMLLRRGYASTLQATMVIPYPGTPLFRELQASGGLLSENWDDYDMRMNVMRGGLPEPEIKAAIREVYSAFLHPETILRRLARTRHPLEDLRFYWRGFRSVLGHLTDFRNR